MKTKIIYPALLLTMLMFTFACKKDFLEKPSRNEPTLETYYDNATQVRGATGLLYNSIWYEYQDKAFHAIGEVLSGNMYTGDPKYNTYLNFSISGTDEQVTRSWYAFYKVAGNATVLINTFEQKKSRVSDPAFLTQGIAEARFMRGVAYFYLARVFGAVPIITDPVVLAETGKFNVPRYLQADVLKFAIEDLKFAEANLQPSDEPGRVTQYSAKGMMAKIYLYLKDYANAKAKANEVITSGKFSLYPDYSKMFTDPSANNNPEVLFALQWLAAGGYSIGNPIQAYVGPSTLLLPTTGAGWSAILPSIDLLNSYEFGDKRRGWSIMEQGFSRPDWKNVNFPNGFVYDTTYVTNADEKTKIKTGTRSNALKYVVGPGGNGVNVNGTSTDINTYILRYADVLLIYAEATLGANASTADATALKAFNEVRHRAGFGVSADKTSLNADMILHERRVEFAFEGDYWFDIQRLGFAKAKQIVDNQERGTYGFNGKHEIQSIKATLRTEANLFIPIPTTEILTNPELGKPAVPYY
ncbi:RagB/SusD family nutrient uptake outer membrane protein [Pedobacter metabolipauper]|nr:RagB/SusD family nutrient uptake outer membrane protein [Pedobacter metabolipauper]